MSTARVRDAQRLFIALWPSAAVARELAALTNQLHTQWGGRKIIQQNQHVTVSFLGGVEGGRVAAVEQALHAAAGTAFVLELDALEYRRRGGLLWARATQLPAALDELVGALNGALRELGFRIEDRAFVPHVTLLRDARRPAHLPQIAPLRWPVVDITLVRSRLGRGGARYEIAGRVPLTPCRSA